VKRAALALGLVAVATCAAVAFDVSLCPFATLTGIPCPSCGLGRAIVALVLGDPAAAFRFHPLVFAALPAIAAAILHLATSSSLASPRRARSERVLVLGASTLLVAFAAVWVLRFEGVFGGPATVKSIWTSTTFAAR
jgi:hypothetical protein